MSEHVGDVVFRVDQSDNDSDIWDDSALIKAYDKAISSVKNMTKNSNGEKQNKQPKKTKRGGKKKNKKTPTQSKWRVGDRCRAVFTEDDQIYSAVIRNINSKGHSCRIRYVGYGNEEDKRLSEIFSESEVEASADLENGFDSMEWTDHSQSPMHPASGVGPRKRTHHPLPPRHAHPYAPHPPPPGPPPHPHIPGAMPYGSWYPPPPTPPPPPLMSSVMTPLPFAPWGSPNPHMIPTWGGTPTTPGQTQPRVPPLPPDEPPHPPLPEDVDSMDKEALHSMLMAWYMSGYHTGFYQGLKSAKSSNKSSPRPDASTVPTPAQSREKKGQTKPEEERGKPPDTEENKSRTCESTPADGEDTETDS
ncbi:uncharacterized protein [Diadema antillarum]|uniref:uncharacterized protein n=1 Tax=Diadema antillarum TaxID=105358 RepID=UPI003A85E6E1